MWNTALHNGLKRFHHCCDARLAVSAKDRIPLTVYSSPTDRGNDPLTRLSRIQMSTNQERFTCTYQHGVNIPPIGADRLSHFLPLYRDTQCTQLVLHHQAGFSLPQRLTATCDILKKSLQQAFFFH